MKNLDLVKDLLVIRAKEYKEIEKILKESLMIMRKLYIRKGRKRLYGLSLSLFALPEPLITNILGVFLLMLSFKGKKVRLDEIISKNLIEELGKA